MHTGTSFRQGHLAAVDVESTESLSPLRDMDEMAREDGLEALETHRLFGASTSDLTTGSIRST